MNDKPMSAEEFFACIERVLWRRIQQVDYSLGAKEVINIIQTRDAAIRREAVEAVKPTGFCALCRQQISGGRTADQIVASEAVARPDWGRVYRDCGGVNAMEANELVSVTRETLRLASSALRAQNHADAYHNAIEAEREINDAIRGTP